MENKDLWLKGHANVPCTEFNTLKGPAPDAVSAKKKASKADNSGYEFAPGVVKKLKPKNHTKR